MGLLSVFLSLPSVNAIRVIVYTDHKPLVFTNHMYNHIQRLMRWALLAQDYNPDIRHRKDIDNITAHCPEWRCSGGLNVSVIFCAGFTFMEEGVMFTDLFPSSWKRAGLLPSLSVPDDHTS